MLRGTRLRYPGRPQRRLLRPLLHPHGRDAPVGPHHAPVYPQAALGRRAGAGERRRQQDRAAEACRDEALHGSADPSLQALYRGLPRAGRRGLCRRRGAEGRVRRLSRRRRHQQALPVQNPRSGLRPSPGHGFSQPRPPACRHLGHPWLARHRVRGGGSMSVSIVPDVRMNVDEFLAWSERQPAENRYELVDGEVVPMSPERYRHSLVKFEAAKALDAAVKAAGVPCRVLPDGPGVVINDRTTRVPDASVRYRARAKQNPESTVLAAPLIVLEVVSPSTERDDLGDKLVEYLSV